MKPLYGRLGYLLAVRKLSLRKIATTNRLDQSVFTKVLAFKRNTKRYVTVLENTFKMPIQDIRSYYKSDKNFNQLDRDTKIKLMNEMQRRNA